MSDNISEEFDKITQHLSDLDDPTIAVSLVDVSKTLEKLNEASFHLAAFMTKVVSLEQGDLIAFPYDLVNILPEISTLCEATCDILHPEICDACSDEDDEFDDEEEELG